MQQYQTREQRMKFYKSKSWRKLRLFVLERDNYECQECKRQGRVFTSSHNTDKHKNLDVDHIEELPDRPDLAMEPDNLETLCIRCHNRKHGRYVSRFKRKPNKWDGDEWW
ncbi:alpha/beta hydrolase [Halalkalibacillus sediminis]|uniref:Putative HNH nuclease YajD n=1 Tax=Halalkalibacillus sediminis TaxID=2018042 RepID=A0A2I0QYK9_9BACI|nr:HNH endonuclease [Halalkalibacillus sediminis]PKR79408.1 alpha/beta hydrolase [Halalkalibacillus sediminis]